jgi:uncharacterized protein (TIGR00255 family)
MLRSMTGYARATASNDAYEVVAEVRSVNHRYLEVRMKAQGGAGLPWYDREVRDRVGAVLSRGKVDVSLSVKPLAESVYEIEVDRALMADFVRLSRSLAGDSSVPGDLSLSDVAGFSPAFQVRERALSEDSKLEDALGRALSSALSDLEKMRDAEGAEMAADLATRVETIGSLLAEIQKRSAETRALRRAELEAKVSELVAAAAEPPVIASEVARLVERADVSEEITRLRSHIALWQATVAGAEPCGKKLDFIVQEMNREVNTIGSKCQDARITEWVIATKSELERVREQVQNVE